MAKPAGSPELLDSPDGPLAKTQAVLARELGCSASQVHLWMKHPEAPTPRSDARYAVMAWKEFVAANSRKVTGKRNAEITEKHSLEVQRLEEQVRAIRLKNDIEEGQLISVEEVSRVLTELTAGLKSAQTSMKHRLAQELAGCDVPEATKRIGEESRALLQEIADGEWCKKKALVSPFFAKLSALQYGQPEPSLPGSGLKTTS